MEMGLRWGDFYGAQVRARHFYARQIVYLTTEIFFDYMIVFLAV